MRGAVLICVVATLGSCGEATRPIPDVDLLVRVSTTATAVTPGKAFPIEVVRVWDRTFDPSPWEARALAPLVLRLRATTRREAAGRIEETHAYDAYAFVRSDVRIPAVVLAAKTPDGELRITRSQRKRLRVTPAVDSEAPGAPELPAAPDTEPEVPLALWGVLAALLALAVAAFRRARPTGPGTPVPSDPHDALARLRDAREPLPPTEIADLLRRYLSHGLLPEALERTTDEIDDALRAWGPDGVREDLVFVLAQADRCKYAGHVPALDEVATVFARAQRVVPRFEAARP